MASRSVSADGESRMKITAFPGAVERLDELLAEDVTAEIILEMSFSVKFEGSL